MALKKPLAVFDSGIGSYGAVEAIHRALPKQDILYLADRQSFPYGKKTRNELLNTMMETVRFLKGYDPSGILIASNAPSILVLEELARSEKEIPIWGIVPPLEEALQKSQTGQVGILGVQSLVESEMLQDFILKHHANPNEVACINASSMVELVESGLFQFNPVFTGEKVRIFLSAVRKRYPQIDVFTLSSTHLPWLRVFFEQACPSCMFIDPLDAVVQNIGSGVEGRGMIHGLVTESPEHIFADFQKLLLEMGIDIPLEKVQIR